MITTTPQYHHDLRDIASALKSQYNIVMSWYNDVMTNTISIVMQKDGYSVRKVIPQNELIQGTDSIITLIKTVVSNMVSELNRHIMSSGFSNIFSDSTQTLILKLKDFARQRSKVLIQNLYMFGNAKQFDSHKIIIAGGCFTSMFNNETPRDVDVFLLNDANLKKTFDHMFEGANTFSADTVNPIADKSDYIRSNKKIVKVVEHNFIDIPKSQYIYTEYDTRKELIDHFDFVHTTISYNIGEDKLYLTKHAIDCIMNKRLVVNGNNKPEQWRVEKFTNKGWKFVIDENVLV